MRRRMGWLLLLCVLLAGLSLAEEQEQVIVDVVDGRLLSDGVDLPLADVEMPVALGYEGGIAVLRVQTTSGVQHVTLGPVQVALTQGAAAYVRALSTTQDEPSGDICPICGRGTALGNHTLMPCGHYGCLKPADHLQVCSGCKGYVCNGRSHEVCKSCKVRMCVHVDLECEYTRNPAPTPYATKTPEGKVVSYYEDPDGQYIAGVPEGESSTEWSPGVIYWEEHTPPEMRGGNAAGAAGGADAGGMPGGARP